MNPFFYHILLGIIQGLTEFIPVSSSAHLVFVQNMFNVKEPQILFDVILHLGTLFAVMAYFYKDILEILKSLFCPKSSGFKMALLVVAGTIPTGVVGFLFKNYFESLFGSPAYTAAFLIVTGFILFSTKFIKVSDKQIDRFSFLDALIIGFAQAVAIAPGISRSGITISSGIWRGIDRKLCAKYSLLLSIPAILGAVASQVKDIAFGTCSYAGPMFAGLITAFIVGYAAIGILVKLLMKAKFYVFSYYCWIVGTTAFIYFTKF